MELFCFSLFPKKSGSDGKVLRQNVSLASTLFDLRELSCKRKDEKNKYSDFI